MKKGTIGGIVIFVCSWFLFGLVGIADSKTSFLYLHPALDAKSRQMNDLYAQLSLFLSKDENKKLQEAKEAFLTFQEKDLRASLSMISYLYGWVFRGHNTYLNALQVKNETANLSITYQ